jgi:hypothetical protein
MEQDVPESETKCSTKAERRAQREEAGQRHAGANECFDACAILDVIRRSILWQNLPDMRSPTR